LPIQHVREIADVVRRARLQHGMITEQRSVRLRHARRGKLRVITGVPGAGKTFLIDRIADAYRADGYNVRAVLVANSAVDVLRRDSSVPARSVCSEMFTWEIEQKSDSASATCCSSTGVDLGQPLGAGSRPQGPGARRDGSLTGDHRQFRANALPYRRPNHHPRQHPRSRRGRSRPSSA
jgi:hypothetical protein